MSTTVCFLYALKNNPIHWELENTSDKLLASFIGFELMRVARTLRTDWNAKQPTNYR